MENVRKADPSFVNFKPRTAVEAVHQGLTDPGMHRTIMRHPEKYLVRDDRLGALLAEIRASGKKSFLLTNSPFPFVDAGMRYILDDDEWRRHFDIVSCTAAKPAFFNSTRPFRKLWRPSTGSPELSWKTVDSFEPGSVYVHGSVDAFHKLGGFTSPDRILYIGDNLPSDLVSPARKHSWRTAAIIRELESEIAVTNSEQALRLRGVLAETKKTISALTDAMYSASPDAAAEHYVAALGQLRREHRETEEAIAGLFTAPFGPTMRARDHVSHFCATVEKYADVYTASVVNFLRSGGLAYDYFPKVRLAQHESPPPPPGASP